VKKYLLYIIYIVVLFAIYSILRYYLIEFDRHSMFFSLIRIFFASPALIILGVVVLIIYDGMLNKIVGWISILTGTFWLFQLIIAILEESGVI